MRIEYFMEGYWAVWLLRAAFKDSAHVFHVHKLFLHTLPPFAVVLLVAPSATVPPPDTGCAIPILQLVTRPAVVKPEERAYTRPEKVPPPHERVTKLRVIVLRTLKDPIPPQLQDPLIDLTGDAAKVVGVVRAAETYNGVAAAFKRTRGEVRLKPRQERRRRRRWSGGGVRSRGER
jgi:hypothetical protein